MKTKQELLKQSLSFRDEKLKYLEDRISMLMSLGHTSMAFDCCEHERSFFKEQLMSAGFTNISFIEGSKAKSPQCFVQIQ